MRKFKWTVEFTVDKTWVEDGFNLTDEKATEMLNKVLAFAYSHEVKAKVLSAPTATAILRAQGYEPAKMSAKEIKAALA